MMKAAQAPGVGGMPLGGPNQGGHSPSHQNLHGGKLNFKLDSPRSLRKTQLNFHSHVLIFAATGGGSSSGSPSHFLPPGHSPTPSSTPVSELSPGKYKFTLI